MSKSLSLEEWSNKIDRLERAKDVAKKNQDWEEWQQIAYEGEEVHLDDKHK